jgi:hypothetical protein
MSLVSKEWVDVKKGMDGSRHPVGVPDADPRVAVKTASSLDHSLEVRNATMKNGWFSLENTWSYDSPL